MKTGSRVLVKISLVLILLGLVFLVVGFCTGGRWNGYRIDSNNQGNMSETYDNSIKNLNLKVSMGNLTVISGDEFQVIAENVDKDSYNASVVNNTLNITNTENNNFSIFGINVNHLWIGFDTDFLPNITVVVPEEVTLENIKIDIAAGSANIEDITGNTAEFILNAGEITGNNLILKENTQISIQAGELNLNGIDAKDLKLNCNMGDAEVSGRIYGDNNISCNMGDITLNLEGSEDEYYFGKITQTFANVDINSSNISHIKNENGMDVLNRINLDCNMGNIDINTK